MNEKNFNPTKMSNRLNFNCTNIYRKKIRLIIICTKYSWRGNKIFLAGK